MLSYKKFVNKLRQNKKYTLMIIPNSTDNITQFTISYRSVVSVATSLFIIFVSLTTFSSKFFYVNNILTTTNESFITLQEENISQKEKIDYLVKKSEEVYSKLEGLTKLESQVMNLVGLDTNNNNDEFMANGHFLVSRSDFRSFILDDNYEEGIDILKILIEEQTEHMKQLINDVENQLVYLESIPNLWPAQGKITSNYGFRISPITRRREFHSGIDIANKTNTNIMAAGSGIVTFSGYNGGYGRMVMISHGNGYTTVYAHNTANLVKVGQRVSKGDIIARIGSTGRSTGPHVHFEIRQNGKAINPLTILENN